jgi:nitrile hydratase subunit beta
MIYSMDGVHDLGGMHGFGPILAEVDHQPVFGEPWEARVWAVSRTVMQRSTIDRFRYLIEQMPPAAYLTSTYYARWLWAVERLAAEQGLLDGTASPSPGARPSSSAPLWKGRFERGQQVRVANRVTAGHCRVPRYLRRQVGRIERVACAWPNPGDSASTGVYGEPELVYTVVFAAGDLFGPGADHTLSADVGERDLEVP